jgi:hypothetical protein
VRHADSACARAAQALHAHGIGGLTRELRADGELLFRFDAAPRGAGRAPQVVRKNAHVLALVLPLHLLAWASAREPKPEGGWAQELAPGRFTAGARSLALLCCACAGSHCARACAAGPLEHLLRGAVLLLHLLELAASKKHPRLEDALFKCASLQQRRCLSHAR